MSKVVHPSTSEAEGIEAKDGGGTCGIYGAESELSAPIPHAWWVCNVSHSCCFPPAIESHGRRCLKTWSRSAIGTDEENASGPAQTPYMSLGIGVAVEDLADAAGTCWEELSPPPEILALTAAEPTRAERL